MCCATFIAKYMLFIANLVFSLLGLAIVGLGIALLVGLNDIQEILPVGYVAYIVIVLGVVVFFIGFLACCGAIRESRCMLICYSIIVSLLLIGFIALTVVVMGSLGTLQETVDQWIVSAFNDINLRPVFHVLEAAFLCCGTVGASAYIELDQPLPPTCCETQDLTQSCAVDDTYRGCGAMVWSWLDTLSGAVGTVLIVIIIVQSVAVILAGYMSYSISEANKEKRRAYY